MHAPVAFAVLAPFLFAACAAPAPAPVTVEPGGAPTEGDVRPASHDDERHPDDQVAQPVPAAVVAVHRKIDEPFATGRARPRCIVTVHDGALTRDRFHAVALFEGGAVATWTQTSTGPVEPFAAKLTAQEDARARGLLDAIREDRGAARERFAPAETVVGISYRVGEGSEASYFVVGEKPAALDDLMKLLRDRLEATNAR